MSSVRIGLGASPFLGEIMEHIGTKFPTKEAFITWVKAKRPDYDPKKLEQVYKEQQEGMTIMLDAFCREHGKFQYPAYDEEGWHQYHIIPECPQCKANSLRQRLNDITAARLGHSEEV